MPNNNKSFLPPKNINMIELLILTKINALLISIYGIKLISCLQNLT